MIIGFFGLMSSGKGVISTAFLRWIRAKNYKKIIANCYLNTKDVLTVDTGQLYEKSLNPRFFKDSYLYITELHNIIDARRASSLMNTNFTQFLTQVGKLDCDVIYDSQLFESQIDLRMREFTPLRFICERFIIKEGRMQSAEFEKRIPDDPIAIKVMLDITRGDSLRLKNLGYYVPKQEDFDYYKTREIITIDREKYKSGRR